jgi:hypothetical protein
MGLLDLDNKGENINMFPVKKIVFLLGKEKILFSLGIY